MALRREDDREIRKKRNTGKNRIGQAASGRTGLFDLRENRENFSGRENLSGKGFPEPETPGTGRKNPETEGFDQRPYRERHRVEVGGQNKKSTSHSTEKMSAGELKEWSFPVENLQYTDDHRQGRVIRGNAPRNRRSPYSGNTQGTYSGNTQGSYSGNAQGTYSGNAQGSYSGNTQRLYSVNTQRSYSGNKKEADFANTRGTESGKKEISTDLLSSKRPTGITGRQSARYGSDGRDRFPEYGNYLGKRSGPDPVREIQEREKPARGRSGSRDPDPIRKAGRIPGQEDVLRDYSDRIYPAPEENNANASDSSASRKRKREQARKERERQIRKFYLMAGSGIFLVLVLAVFVLVSLIKGGDKNSTDTSGMKTESSVSEQPGIEIQTETVKEENADNSFPDTPAAESEGSDQEEVLTEASDSPDKTDDNTVDAGQPADQEEALAGSGQEDAEAKPDGVQTQPETQPEQSSLTAQETDGAVRKYTHQDDWRLIVVNPWNKIPEGYTVQTTSLINGESVDSRCYGELVRMLDACRAGGGAPIVCSSYRPHEKQVMLFDNQVSSLMSQGMSREEAQKEAGTVVAVPGTSEHELGLAVDICDTANQLLDESQADTPTQKWLMEHCWEYGFILRYPPEKTALTGIIYEPWHYRYVGKEAAEQIRQRNICLEEYLSQ